MLSKKWHDNVYCILIGAFHIYQAIQGIDYAITFVYTEEEKNTEKSIFEVKNTLSVKFTHPYQWSLISRIQMKRIT